VVANGDAPTTRASPSRMSSGSLRTNSAGGTEASEDKHPLPQVVLQPGDRMKRRTVITIGGLGALGAAAAYELANSFLGELPRLRDQVRLHRVSGRLAVLRAQERGVPGPPRRGGALVPARWRAAAEALAQARLGDRAALMEKLSLAEAELDRAPSGEGVPSVFGRHAPRPAKRCRTR
jgi:hypothetical protein